MSFQVQLYSVLLLLNVYLACFPNFFLSFCYYSGGPYYYWYDHTHLMIHICFISMHKPLYFNFFSAYFCIIFLSTGIVTYYYYYFMNLIFRPKYKPYVRLSMQHIISNVTPLPCLQLSLYKQYSTQNVHISLPTISIPKIPSSLLPN